MEANTDIIGNGENNDDVIFMISLKEILGISFKNRSDGKVRLHWP